MEIKSTNNQYTDLHNGPNECPYCHHLVTPNYQAAFIRHTESPFKSADVFYTCANNACQRGFVAIYRANGHSANHMVFEKVAKPSIASKEIPQLITALSPSFGLIYNQAFAAEQMGLMQVCGLGYRKALEFLIKDYLVSKHPDKDLAIKEMQLMNCIQNMITNDNIKEVAKRAVWLGNDETHYVRIWETKDVSDLKKLINITLHYVEMELQTQEYINSMPPIPKHRKQD